MDRECFGQLRTLLARFFLSFSCSLSFSSTVSSRQTPPTNPPRVHLTSRPPSSTACRSRRTSTTSLSLPRSSPTLRGPTPTSHSFKLPSTMFRLTLISAVALLSIPSVYASVVSTSVFPNSACAGSSSLGGLVGIGKVTLASGEVETHCGCPSVRAVSFPLCARSFSRSRLFRQC